MRVNKFTIAIIISLSLALSACSVKTPQQTLYKLDAYTSKPLRSKPRAVSILITQPDAVGGYQTEQMLYMNQPYALGSFVKSAWISPPATMLLPLMIQSFQDSGYFYAVTSAPNGDKAHYRIDTQLIELQQNFLVKPSRIELVIKVVLTQSANDTVLASHVFKQQTVCPEDTPFGGVVAANRATQVFTDNLRDFVIRHIQYHKQDQVVAKN